MKRNNIYKILGIVIILILIILLMRTCNSSSTTKRAENFKIDESYLSIPPEATFIAVFDTPKILSELEFGELRNSAVYDNMLRGLNTQFQLLARVLSNPEHAGLATSRKVAFYASVGSKQSEVYWAVIMPLQNVKSFNSIIDKAGLKDIKRSDKFNSAKMDVATSLAWDDDFVVFIAAHETFNKQKVFRNCLQSETAKYFDENGDFLKYVESCEGDAAFWMDLGSYADNQIHATGKPGEFYKATLEGNFLYGDIDFSKGHVSIDLRSKFNAIVSAMSNKVFNSNYDDVMLNYLPNGKPSLLTSFAVNIEELIKTLTKDIEVKLAVRKELSQYGMIMDDFTQAFSGDVLLVSYPHPPGNKSSVLFGLKIKDRNHFDRLIGYLEKLGNLRMEEEGIYVSSVGKMVLLPIYESYGDGLQRMLIKDNCLFVSFDKEVIDHIKALPEGYQVLNKFNAVNKETNTLFELFGDRSLYELTKVSDDFSAKEFQVKCFSDHLNIQIKLLDENRSSLQQLLSIK